MRKLLAFLLLLVLGLPSALPLFAAAQGEDASLPACCRRHGRHRCAMAESISAVSAGSRETHTLRAAVEACPMRGAILAGVHLDPVAEGAAFTRGHAGVVAYPTVQAQAESRWRMARERARGKRGPPAESHVS